MTGLSPAVRVLLIANAVVFAVGFFLPAWSNTLFTQFAIWFPRHENFAIWQIVSYMFMHGGLGHIFFNMFALASFGLPLEQQWGTRRFVVFYFLCGIGAGLIQTGINVWEFETLQGRLTEAGLTAPMLEDVLRTGGYSGPRVGPETLEMLRDFYRVYATPMVGASGAIYGILVAFGLMYPNAKLALLFLPVPIAAKYFIPVLLALDLLSGVTGFSLFGRGIAHFAHLGGAAIGFLLMWHWRGQARREADAQRWR